MNNNNNKSKLSLYKIISPLAFSLLFNSSAYSHGLLQVYQLAAKKDPQLQQAFADFKSVQQNVPIAVSDLLPEVTLNAGIDYDKVLDFTDLRAGENPSINSKFFSINATQPLFYWDRIHRYLQSNIEAEKAIHDLEVAKEDLLLRVSEAYFAVLEAEDLLEFVSTERKSVNQLYKESLERFNVGLIPIADVDEAKARLDLTTADEIQAQNDVQNRYDELIEIIGEDVNHAKILTPKFKPSSPKPTDVKKWLKMAMARNHLFTSQKLNRDIVEKNEDIAFAGHMPSVDANAQYRGVNSSRSLQVDDISTAEGYLNSFGGSIEGRIEIFGGLGTQAAVEQAEFNTKAEGYVTERVKRETISNTRQAYRNVITNIKQIQALEQGVISSYSALEATKASYDVGTRASIDVLDRLTDLYDQKQRLSSARYQYIQNVLELKRLAGVLTNKDILTIDKWLVDSKNRVRDKFDVRDSIIRDVESKDQKQYGTKATTTQQEKEVPQTKKTDTQDKENKQDSLDDIEQKFMEKNNIESKDTPQTEKKTSTETKSSSEESTSQPTNVDRIKQKPMLNKNPLEELEEKLLELEGIKQPKSDKKSEVQQEKAETEQVIDVTKDKIIDRSTEPKQTDSEQIPNGSLDQVEPETKTQTITKTPVSTMAPDENDPGALTSPITEDKDDRVLRKLELELKRIIEEGNLE